MLHRLYLPLVVTSVILVHTITADILVMIRGSNQIIEEFNDEPARFGASFPINGLRAWAVMSNPSNACQPIESPPNLNTTKVPRFVVIISRGNCSFEEKIRNAQKAGFNAAIVHNVGSNELEPMSANNGDDIDIPSMFVGEATGKIILYNYLYKEGFALILNGDSPFNINTHLLVPFCAVVGLCFIIMVGLMITKCIREQRRLRRHRLPGSVLKKIPIIRFSSKEENCSRFETCAICIEDYVDGDRLRVLPCAHAYHNKCIDPWLTKNRRVCPICKRKVFASGEPRRRRRRSTDDSMSDTDNDDTTPLINPVNQSNANSHGTFRPTAPPEEDAEALHAQHQRFNPFDRQANAILPSAEVIQDSVSFWTRVRRVLHIESDPAPQPDEPNVDQLRREQEIMQTQSNDVQPIASFSSSNSNIGNLSMSGSLRHFRRIRPASIDESRSTDNDDEDDDVDDINDSFHECNEPINNIYSPISMSQPSIDQHSQQQQEQQQQQQYFVQDEVAGPSNQRIAVAALPNLDFDQGATIGGRPFSTSSPSVYSTQQPSNNDTSGSSNGSNNDRRNFVRNTTASSRNYFV